MGGLGDGSGGKEGSQSRDISDLILTNALKYLWNMVIKKHVSSINCHLW